VIADVEVHVARGHQVLAVVEHRTRRRHGDHLEAAAARVGRGAQVGDDAFERFLVRVIGRGRHRDDDTRRHEACERVDVPVGVIVGEPAIEPDHALDAERRAQELVHCVLVEIRVAVAAEQALARRQHRAFAVDLDRAALEDEALRPCRHTGRARHPRRDVRVAGHDVLPAPAVELEARRRAPARAIDDEHRRRVAQPDVAVVGAMEADADRGRPDPRARRRLRRPVGDEQLDPLAARLPVTVEGDDQLDHSRECTAWSIQSMRPLLDEVRPRGPHRFMGCPLGGLAVAELLRALHAHHLPQPTRTIVQAPFDSPSSAWHRSGQAEPTCLTSADR
jgi:hypothetical protein